MDDNVNALIESVGQLEKQMTRLLEGTPYLTPVLPIAQLRGTLDFHAIIRCYKCERTEHTTSNGAHPGAYFVDSSTVSFLQQGWTSKCLPNGGTVALCPEHKESEK